jgi:hypothetical protein
VAVKRHDAPPPKLQLTGDEPRGGCRHICGTDASPELKRCRSGSSVASGAEPRCKNVRFSEPLEATVAAVACGSCGPLLGGMADDSAYTTSHMQEHARVLQGGSGTETHAVLRTLRGIWTPVEASVRQPHTASGTRSTCSNLEHPCAPHLAHTEPSTGTSADHAVTAARVMPSDSVSAALVETTPPSEASSAHLSAAHVAPQTDASYVSRGSPRRSALKPPDRRKYFVEPEEAVGLASMTSAAIAAAATRGRAGRRLRTRSSLIVEERAIAALETGSVRGWRVGAVPWWPAQWGGKDSRAPGQRRPKAIVHTSFWEHFALVRRQLTEVGVILQVWHALCLSAR